MSKLSYNLDEAAAATGLSRSTLDRAIRAGKLKAKRSADDDKTTGKGRGRVTIITGDLQAYLENLADA